MNFLIVVFNEFSVRKYTNILALIKGERHVDKPTDITIKH